MKEQLNNITRELQELKNNDLTQQEKQENEKLYKKELKRVIKQTIEQEIETQQEKGETIENIKKYIILNDDTIKDNIINELYNYKTIKRRLKGVIQSKKEEENGQKHYIEFISYPFTNYDIAEDVDNDFYTILKSVINKNKLKNEVMEGEALEELKQLFIKYYNNYGYKIAKQTLYNEENKQAVVIATTPRSKETIKKNYYKVLNEVDKLHKIQHPNEAKTTTQRKTQKGYIKHRKSFILGSILVGAIDGLKKASK